MNFKRKILLIPTAHLLVASNAVTRTEINAVDITGKEPADDAITCLARTIYWEARGADRTIMQAIANVVMNRLGHEGFPKTICGIVKQGGEKKIASSPGGVMVFRTAHRRKNHMRWPRKSPAGLSTANLKT